MNPNALLREVEEILRREPLSTYSKEEILNLLAPKNREKELEQLLAELEVASSMSKENPEISATCRGGTVYYNWNRTP